MRTLSLPSAFALAVAALAFAGPAAAQSCPPGTYFASDGQCYASGQPAPPPPPPVYYAPVRQPPPVYDGFALGIGLGALVGVLGSDHGGGGRRGGRDSHRR